jgi:hypothetical protein
VHTYFVVLDNHDHAPPLAFFNQIQQDLAGGSGASSPVDVLDATSSNSTIVLATVAQKVTSAITCVYDLPPGVDTTATAAFELPPNTPGVNPGGVPVPQTLPLATGCTLANRGNHSIDGWNIDNGRLVVCGNSCTNLQGAIQAVTASALQSQLGDGGADGGLPSLDGGVNIPDVPMVVTMPCPDGGTP